MTRSTAEKVTRSLLNAVRQVNDNLFLVKPELPEPVYTEYKKQTARVMAANLDLLKPVVKDHPDLDRGLEEPIEQ
jgi:hypothetical protein